jgi:hypothetical protein
VSPRILAVRIVPFQGGSVSPGFTPADRADFESRIQSSLEAFRRIYPTPDVDMVFWPDEVNLPGLVGDDGKVHLTAFELSGAFFAMLGSMNALADYLDSWNNLHPDQKAEFVVGFIESSLEGSGGSGFGVPPISMMADFVKDTAENLPTGLGSVLVDISSLIGDVVCTATLGLFCEDPIEILVRVAIAIAERGGFYDITGKLSLVVAENDRVGSILAQEIGHTMGFVNPYEEEDDHGNPSHSRYDEDCSTCTFYNAPGVFGPVFNVTAPALFHPGNLPKSTMSYAPDSGNDNSFLEPKHYQRIFEAFHTDRIGARMAREEGAAGVEALEGPALRVTGTFRFLDETLSIREARPERADELLTPELPGSPFTLAFLDGAGTVLSEQGFSFNVSLPIHTHDEGGDGVNFDNLSIVGIHQHAESFEITAITRNPEGVAMTWNSEPGKSYTVEYRQGAPLTGWIEVQELPSAGEETSFTDTEFTRTNPPAGWYRVRENP